MQHRPLGIGEDRNARFNRNALLAMEQHRPSGAGEDRNTTVYTTRSSIELAGNTGPPGR